MSSATISQQMWNQKKLNEVADKYSVSSLDMFVDMLSVPNDSHDREMLSNNIRWFDKAFRDRGFILKRLETPSVPALLIERKVMNSSKTILFYMHGDGQPVHETDWDQDSPWKPVFKKVDTEGNWNIISPEDVKNGFNHEYRIFGRSSSDDKGPLAMFLAAVDAIDDAGIKPDFNIKIFLDFEEEIGSPYLAELVEAHTKELDSDILIVFDGPNHNSNKPTLCFGARGITRITLTTYGARSALHSGHYGNYSPNPAFIMAGLLSSMKDDDGKVLIPGFYDGIELTPEEQSVLERVPDDEEEIKRKLGIASSDRVGKTYQESLQYPSLNIRGLQAGQTGENVTNIVPDRCVAEIDIRTVPESDPERLAGLVEQHIRSKGFYITDEDPSDEIRMKYSRIIKFERPSWYQGFRTSMESKPSIWLNSAMIRAFGNEPVKLRILGGSLPITPFINALDIPAVIVPTVNPDNNQHGPNENLRLGNYRDGIKIMIAILTEKLQK